jgi:hypothetical protein
MPAYDEVRFDPPAPVAQVTVRSPRNGVSVANVPLLMDTGADVSLLPAAYVRSLVAVDELSGQYELEGFDGTRSRVPVARLEVHFLGKVFRGQFLLVDQDCGILGRNVLNALSLQLDGPNLAWSAGR